ncbi:hypothetical protein LSTR_LSTR000709 [Laodelphax striatellus]|uniref:Chitin-binding type-2 domain-containing protein n=1 Tax=Laodelphax striatellus TaxID=195883 RepID=A0A482XG98_LAOST|nr:hypothetical protein LSTR_LSTR000709 [Laodelphax striatellus]
MRWQLSCSTLACAVLAVAVVVTAAEEDDVSDRDKRQTPYYTAALPVRSGSGPGPGPAYKPQPTQQQPRFPAAAFSVAPQPFRSSPIDDHESDEVDRNAVSPTPNYLLNRPQPTTPSSQYRSQTPQPQQQQQASRSRPNSQDYRRPQSPQGQRNQFQPQQQLTEEELADLEEDEKEEPDRLTQLLPESKFSCSNKNTGYYADEGLNCEVFHYCQDNARHSWICPEGFLFHQVHLICMPPSSDNICKQSSQYHFVNDYLYRPINEEEVQRKPNTSLRYADRYYPENYYEEAEETHQPAPQVVRRPVQQLQNNYQPQNQNYQLQRPVQQVRQASNTNQVFHSPEEVNIPLQHRRPQPQASQAEDEDY